MSGHIVHVRGIADHLVLRLERLSDGRTDVIAADAKGSVGFIVDPQEIINAMHELYPTMKPTPPTPKFGDKVTSPDLIMPGIVRGVYDGYATIESLGRFSVHPFSRVEVVEPA
jgi:hypothetical protein